jgi:hypothetical protein
MLFFVFYDIIYIRIGDCNMKKNNFIFIMLFLLIVVLVFSVSITYFVIQKSMTGTGIVETSYYDILFTNTTIDFDSKIEVKINDEEDKISIKVPDVNEFLEENSFTIDVKNIGNIDAYVDSMFLSNIDSNIETENFNIDISLVRDDVIKGSESKKLRISITYKGEKLEEESYFNFDINYKFNEVVL